MPSFALDLLCQWMFNFWSYKTKIPGLLTFDYFSSETFNLFRSFLKRSYSIVWLPDSWRKVLLMKILVNFTNSFVPHYLRIRYFDRFLFVIYKYNLSLWDIVHIRKIRYYVEFLLNREDDKCYFMVDIMSALLSCFLHDWSKHISQKQLKIWESIINCQNYRRCKHQSRTSRPIFHLTSTQLIISSIQSGKWSLLSLQLTRVW